MIAKFIDNTLILQGKSKRTKNILEKDSSKIKLAYKLSKVDINGLNIYIGGENFYLDYKNNKAFIGHKNLNENRLIYMLRVILDGYITLKGGLPLHASAISYKDNAIFLFGKSNSGKSLISYSLNKLNQDQSVIGDDHIIVTKNNIFGNYKGRVRNLENTDEIYYNNLQKGCLIKKYTLIEVSIGNDNSIKELDMKEYLKTDLSHVLKYLYEDMITETQTFKIESIFETNIKEIYFNRFKEFINSADKILKISGTKQFIKNYINDNFYI